MGRAFIIPNINFQSSGLGSVTLLGDIPLRMVGIIAPDTFSGETLQLGLSFAPLNTTHRSVIWSVISGSSFASVNSRGLLTIASGTSAQPVTVSAVADNGVSSEKTIIVTYFNSGVTLHDFLLTDGASYFSIGKLGRYDKITVIGKTLGTSPSSANAIFGVAKSSAGDNWIYHLFYNSMFAVSLGNISGEFRRGNIDKNSAAFSTVIDFSTGGVVIGTISGSASIEAAAFVNDLTPFEAYAFAANKGNAPVSMMGADSFALAELIIERGGDAIHDFKPAESDGVYGAYDTITGQMMPNLGTGAFSVE